MNPYLYRDPNDPSAEPVVVLPYGGFYNRDEMSMRAYDVRNSLSYNKVFDNGVRTQELNVLAACRPSSPTATSTRTAVTAISMITAEW